MQGLFYHEDEDSALLRNDGNICHLAWRNMAEDLNLKLQLEHQCDVKLGSLRSFGILRSVPTFRNNFSVPSSRVKKSLFMDFLSLEDGNKRLSPNVGTELPFYAHKKTYTLLGKIYIPYTLACFGS